MNWKTTYTVLDEYKNKFVIPEDDDMHKINVKMEQELRNGVWRLMAGIDTGAAPDQTVVSVHEGESVLTMAALGEAVEKAMFSAGRATGKSSAMKARFGQLSVDPAFIVSDMSVAFRPGFGMVDVITDQNAYKYVWRVCGIPAGHKPNTNRPYYRKVRTVKYLCYFMPKMNKIICHPKVANRLKEMAK